MKSIMSRIELNREKIERWLPLVALAVMFTANLVFLFLNGNSLLNSDDASEMILADLLNKTHGGAISEQWYYSTELRVIHSTQLFRLGLLLFPENWFAARLFSVILAHVLIVLSVLFLFREIGDLRCGLYAACGILCPLGPYYARLISWFLYYVFFVGITFISLSFYIHIQKAADKRRRLFWFAGGVCLAFLSSLGGIRMPMICYAPLFLTAVLCFFLQITPDNKVSLLFTSAMLLSSGAGYYINDRVLKATYSFMGHGAAVLDSFSVHDLLEETGKMLSLFGWKEKGIAFMSISGISNVAGMMLGIAALGYLFCYTISAENRTKLPAPVQQIALFALIAFCVLLIVYSQMDDTLPAYYWVPYIPVLIMALVAIFPHTKAGKNSLQGHLCVMAYYLILSICFFGTARHPETEWWPSTRKSILAAIDYISESGYENGTATFWNSNIVTELTDGKVEMWSIVNDGALEMHRWLQNKKHMDQQPENVFFFLLSKDEAEEWEKRTILSPYVVYENEDYYVCEFDSWDYFWNLLQ